MLGKYTEDGLWPPPPHRRYVSVFGGTGIDLFCKPRATYEILNDKNGDIYNTFHVTQDAASCRELFRLLKRTPYSRQQFREAIGVLESEEADPVRRAWAWLLRLNMCFHGGHDSRWFSTCRPKGLYKLPRLLMEWHERLRGVIVECEDWEFILNNYDSPDTYFFLDPPYHPDTIHTARYGHSLTRTDHIRLLERLQTIQGKAFICGYYHADYQRHLVSWRRFHWDTYSCLRIGREQQSAKRVTEYAWLNYTEDGRLIDNEVIPAEVWDTLVG